MGTTLTLPVLLKRRGFGAAGDPRVDHHGFSAV
jgi:hypothetical protein